jgi:hypothetical protein
MFDPAKHAVDWAPSPDEPGAVAACSCTRAPSPLPPPTAENYSCANSSLSLLCPPALTHPPQVRSTAANCR